MGQYLYPCVSSTIANASLAHHHPSDIKRNDYSQTLYTHPFYGGKRNSHRVQGCIWLSSRAGLP